MRSYGHHCALARALDRVGDRWTLLIVRELLVGPRRWSDLRDGLPGIAPNLLATRLRDLQEENLVRRDVLPPPAASAVYELTSAGEALAEPVFALVRWGGSYMTDRAAEDDFRPHWLVIALRALFARRPLPPRAWTLDVGDAALVLGPDRIGLAAGSDLSGPRLRADAEVVLGLAAGRVELEDTITRGLVEVTGADDADFDALQAVLDATGASPAA